MRPAKFFLVAGVALIGVLIGLPSSDETAWAESQVFSLVWESGEEVWISNEIEAPLTQVGLTWADDPPSFIAVRTLRDDAWGPWMSMTVEADHSPDPGTDEYKRQRSGTDLMWVGEADGAQFMVTGITPEDAEASLIDTTDRTKPLVRRVTDMFSSSIESAGAAPGQPFIHPRSDWDPSGSCEPKADPSEVQVTHAFVHHTTGENDYTTGEVASRILGICLFHTGSNGWDDIGYNFLIDRFGGIWEGRDGGIEAGVQGAHTAGFNSYSTGVAFIGEHTGVGPTAAAEAALVDLLSWKFGLHNVEPIASSVLVSKGSSKWPEGTPVLMKPISGHRDAQATTCPGEACYQRLPIYRSDVDSNWSQIPLSLYQNPLVGDFDGDDSPEGAVFRTSDGVWALTQPYGSISAWADFSTGAGWSKQLVGDFNGDGRDDIANFNTGTGKWMVSLSTGTAFATSKWEEFTTRTGWTSMVGDYNGDGRDDIANYHSGTGKWMISQSTGSSFTTTKWEVFATKTGWTSMVGDFDGDGQDDLANFHSGSGNWVVSISGAQSMTTSVWNTFATKSGWGNRQVGDYNGDGRDDIASHHDGSGNWVVAISSGTNLSTSVWAEYDTPDHLSYEFSLDADEDGLHDLFAVDAYNGYLVSLISDGSNFAIETTDTPWRITWGGKVSPSTIGDTSMAFFGQEFQWIHMVDLDTGSPDAIVIAGLARP